MKDKKENEIKVDILLIRGMRRRRIEVEGEKKGNEIDENWKGLGREKKGKIGEKEKEEKFEDKGRKKEIRSKENEGIRIRL